MSYGGRDRGPSIAPCTDANANTAPMARQNSQSLAVANLHNARRGAAINSHLIYRAGCSIMAPLVSETIFSMRRGDRRTTFDPGARNTLQGNAVRARFQGLVKSVPIKKGNYKHATIDYDHQIRILKILRGEPEADIECMLFPSTLGPATSQRTTDQYYALSYWWGDEKEVASNKIKIYSE